MKHYLFDIGGVLINFSIEKLVNNLVSKTGVEKGKIEKIFSYNCLYQVETGKISPEEYLDTYIKPILNRFTYEDLIACWMNNYSLKENGLNLMLTLKKLGRKVYILSNLAEHNTIAINRKFPELLNYTEKNFFSYELGYHKPEAEIYQTVINTVNAKPEDIYFFDDTIQNIEGAIKTGINGYVFSDDNYRKIKEELIIDVN